MSRIDNIARQLQGMVLTESEAETLIQIIKVRVRGQTTIRRDEGMRRDGLNHPFR